MAMMQWKLIDKILLAPDIYELHYDIWEKKEFLAWQFITFILPNIGWRAYSILKLEWSIIILIIKRWSDLIWWRGGSMALCDANIWEEFKCVGPAWHFTLTGTDTTRCFLWTGTWFVPLYNQILWSLIRWDTSQIKLVFWVRTKEDLFYLTELQKLSVKYPHFSFVLYLSRENTDDTIKWYVTDFLTSENIDIYNEYYICGAPAMIDSCGKKLSDVWFPQKNIFFEKYA